MDREKIIKELTDPSANRKIVFDHAKRVVKDYVARKETGKIGEFVEFALLRETIKEAFGLQSSFEQKIVDFVLAFSLGLADAVTENNRRWFQVLVAEEK